MHTRPVVTRAVTYLLLALSIAACRIGEVTHETVTIPIRAKKETVTCESPFEKVDLGALEACGDGRGKGHCYDAKKVPLAKKDLMPCAEEGTVCVPDKILEANGSKLKSCAFFIGGKPGVCMSTLIHDIDLNKNQLQADVCDADERCAPCVNPIDGKDTGICEAVGAHEKDCTGAAADEDVEPCCHGMGLCMPEDSTPEDQRGSMSRDTCSDAKLCAPAAMVDGTPVKCSFLGAPGVCLDVCFNQMLAGMKAMARADCGPTEVCLPCAIGKGQGVVGCD